MDKLKTIICGIDFSEGSKCALRQAARMAEWSGARLLAVHIVEGSLWDLFPDVPKAELVAKAADKLDEIVFEVLGDSHNAEQKIIKGHPFKEIANLVEAESADLLVLGVHGHGTEPGAGSPAGTLACKCVRKIPTKVMLIRGDQPGNFKKIIHCTDFSKTAARAFEQAIAVARHDGATLEILHAVLNPDRVAFGIMDAHLFRMLKTKNLRLQEKLDMGKYIEPFRSALEGIDCKTTIVEAEQSAGATLIDRIARGDADLAVLGTHGRRAIEGMLMGTTAEKIVSRAPCSVLAIKPKNYRRFW